MISSSKRPQYAPRAPGLAPRFPSPPRGSNAARTRPQVWLANQGQYLAMLEKSEESGFYTARVSVQAPGMPVAVNVDTRESDVACVDETELRESLQVTGITVSADEAGLMADISMARTGRSYWRFFMIVALCLLVAESLFADRLQGRKQSSGQSNRIATPSMPLKQERA